MESKLEVRLVVIEDGKPVVSTGAMGGESDLPVLLASVSGRAMQMSVQAKILPRFNAGGEPYDTKVEALAAGHTSSQIVDTWRDM